MNGDNNGIIKLIALLTLIFNCDILLAKEDNDNPVNFLNSSFFSLSKKKEDAFDAPSAVYVLSSEDIRRSGVSSIPEALRMVPGLQVARIDGNKWAISSRGFNRQYSNKLLILVDGRTVYTSTFSGAFWEDQDYVLDDIEKIEVVRGPGGTIWGANAVNGIINIITKSAADTQGGYISQTSGNYDRSITEIRYGGKVNEDSYRIYGKKSYRNEFTNLSDGRDADDNLSHDRFGFRYDMLPKNGNKLSVHGDFFDGNSNNYFNSETFNIHEDRDSRGANLVFNWNGDISDKSSFMLQGYYDYTQSDKEILVIDEKVADLDFQFFHNFSRDNQLIIGAGYRNIQDRFRFSTTENQFGEFIPLFYSPKNRNNDLYTTFIQHKIGLVPDKLYLTIGTKFEHNDLTGFEYQPNAKLAYYPTRNQTLWASVSRAVRTPTRGEDALQITAPVAGQNRIVQSGDLDGNFDAEDLIAYEAGYRVKPTESTAIDFASFFNDYTNLRTFESGGGLNTPVTRNNGYGKSYGFEVSGKWQVSDDWKVETSYDFIKMNFELNRKSTESITALNSRSLSDEEDQVPQNQLRFRSLYNISPKVEFDNYLYWVDSLPGAGSNDTTPGVPSYVRVDTRLGYLYSSKLDFSFGIRNIFDDRHQEFSAGLLNKKVEVGRTYYAKAVLQF